MGRQAFIVPQGVNLHLQFCKFGIESGWLDAPRPATPHMYPLAALGWEALECAEAASR